METTEFLKRCLQTESLPAEHEMAERSNEEARLLHGVMGLATESGEALDIFKKKLFYGKQVDPVNLCEEVGDIFWYLAIILDEIENRFAVDLEQILRANVAKLQQKRYARGEIDTTPEFTEFAALFRDTGDEYAIMQKVLGLEGAEGTRNDG